MGKLCERPGCSDVAAMAYGFDVDRLLVWLSPRDPDADPARAGSLCKRHADAMVVPRGWTLDDRRVDQQRLFRPRADETPAPTPSTPPDAPPRRPRRSRAKSPGAQTLEVVVAESATAEVPVVVELAVAAEVVEELESRTVVGVTGEPTADIDPDATQAIPWLPSLDDDDDLDGVLSADSPLLARAFRGTDRKR